jgi:hypothetical protein
MVEGNADVLLPAGGIRAVLRRLFAFRPAVPIGSDAAAGDERQHADEAAEDPCRFSEKEHAQRTESHQDTDTRKHCGAQQPSPQLPDEASHKSRCEEFFHDVLPPYFSVARYETMS